MPELPSGIHACRPLAPLTSLKIGGSAAWFAQPSSPAELLACLQAAEQHGRPVFALGGGSNLLVADSGYAGLVLRYYDATERLEESGATARLRAGARAPLAGTARRLAHAGWSGLEWAEGIPGTVGGAVVGNAGAYGGDIASVVCEVEVCSLEGTAVIAGADCGFAYRDSRFHGQDPTRVFITAVTFELRVGDPEALASRVRAIGESRKARTPVGLSCGSVWKNPEGDSSGRLIEAAGLKGEARGGARISPLHANYIVNESHASAEDVLALMRLARRKVFEATGILLAPEVMLVGFPPGVLEL